MKLEDTAVGIPPPLTMAEESRGLGNLPFLFPEARLPWSCGIPSPDTLEGTQSSSTRQPPGGWASDAYPRCSCTLRLASIIPEVDPWAGWHPSCSRQLRAAP